MQATLEEPARTARVSAVERIMADSRKLEGQRLATAVPKELYETKVWRGLLGFAASVAVWGGGIWLIAIAPHWSLWIPFALISGLGGWGLHCIAHECGHASFSKSKRLNGVIGHLALVPMLYPFNGWKHIHDMHHANTNSLEKDTDWRPVTRGIFGKLSLVDKAVYFGTRSVLFWLGTAHYQLKSGFRTDIFPKRSVRMEVRKSFLFILAVTAVTVPLVVMGHGWMGVFKFIVLPWVGMHAWFSATTLMHHTSQEIPFLKAGDWNVNASKLLLTTDYRYPKWLHFLTHNITIHTAHHVAPKVPFYHLVAAQKAIKAAYPGMLRERPFTWKALYVAVSQCHLYDFGTGLYEPFAARKTGHG
jgi:omega-6 fatty acid desaturase (delta-12 desaturase)